MQLMSSAWSQHQRQRECHSITFSTRSQVTGAVGWRRNGIRYKKNEVFLDIVETVNVLLNSKGDVLRSEVLGKMHMKVRPYAITPGGTLLSCRGLASGASAITRLTLPTTPCPIPVFCIRNGGRVPAAHCLRRD